MYREDILLKVRPQIVAHLEKGGYVLVDSRFYKNQFGELIFELLVDREEGGITLGECASLNKELGVMLERSEYLQDRYMLELSSPGLDRPLATFSDFKRAIGAQIRIFLKEGLEGKIEYQGSIESVAEDKILLKTQTKTIEIPLDKVNKAKRVIL